MSVRDALLDQPVLPMPPGKFPGAGIYAIYYIGAFKQYRQIADLNKDNKFACPIYVGKAVPKGSRKGGLINDPKGAVALAPRLKHHADSIQAANNLRIEDFFFRCLVVDDIWIPLGETYMIEKFQPVWNKVVEGFGDQDAWSTKKGPVRLALGHDSSWPRVCDEPSVCHPTRKAPNRS